VDNAPLVVATLWSANMKRMDYRQEDMDAWFAENPWDQDTPPDVIAGTIGFKMFSIHRQAGDIGGLAGAVIQSKVEGLQTHVQDMNLRVIKRYFAS
jgi:hypothetical protein